MIEEAGRKSGLLVFGRWNQPRDCIQLVSLGFKDERVPMVQKCGIAVGDMVGIDPISVIPRLLRFSRERTFLAGASQCD